MDGAGFDPATSTMPTTRKKLEKSDIYDFTDFLRINMRLERATIINTLGDVKRFLKKSDYVVSYENVKRYLESYINQAAKTYNSQITSLRRFIRDFLRLPQLIMSFKMTPVDVYQFYEDLPSKE